MSERRGSGREGYNVLYNIIIYREGKLLKKNWEIIERQRKRKREKESERKAHSKYNHRCQQPSRLRRNSIAFGVFVPLSCFTLELSRFMQRRTFFITYTT